jgi:hypothetical protein
MPQELEAEALSSRQAFLCGLSDLPPVMRATVIRNYDERIARGNGRPLLGEYAPWLLADVLPLRSREVIDRVSPAWMNLYAYTLFVDDVLDIRRKPDAAPLLLASQLLLERGLASLYAVLSPGSWVCLRIDGYFLEAATAVLSELQGHRNLVRDYTEDELKRLGQKVSFLKLCAASMLSADGHGEDQYEDCLIPIEDLATGMQLLDDVTDWLDDWKSGSYTPLLTRTFRRLEDQGLCAASAPQCLEPIEVLTAMILTGSLDECVRMGLAHLQNVAAAPDLRRPSCAARILDQIIAENLALCADIAKLRASCASAIDVERAPDLVRVLVARQQVRRQVEEIDKKLRIVAQNT